MDIFVKAGPALTRGILKLDDLAAPCALGHGGVETAKKEGDGITPAGAWPVRRIWYRPDREPRPIASLEICQIDRKTGWCDDIKYSQKYNRLVNIKDGFKCEKLKRGDYKYDLFIPIKYNFINPVVGLGSAIFIHLTKNYKPTAGCIALSKKDFLIMLKIIKKNSKIKIL